MNEKEVLILARDKENPDRFVNKTKEIVSINQNGDYYEITFANGQYSYKKNNVQYFNQPEPVNNGCPIVTKKGKEINRWNYAVKFHPYICLFDDENSKYEYELIEDIEIIDCIEIDDPSQQLFEYYKHIVSLLEETTPHLGVYFNNKLDAVREDSVLNNFLNKLEPNKEKISSPPIFPFGVNPSQREAVINALESQISLIQGPPGTGKTQTILNIIANLLMRGKTVAIAAGNNSATANVYEKLESENIHFVAAKLGNKDLQTEFFGAEHPIPDLTEWSLEHQEQQDLNDKASVISGQISMLLDSKNQLAIVKEQLNRLTLEKEIFEQHFSIDPINLNKWSFANRWSSPNLLKFLAEVEYCSEKNKLTLPAKLRWLYQYGIYRFKDLNNLNDDTVKSIVREYYSKRSEELRSEIESLEALLNKKSFESLLEDYVQVSLRLFKHDLSIWYKDHEPEEFQADGRNSYKNNFSVFLDRFPVVLSTTDSIINNKNQYELFDYLIVDEASQVDLLTGVLAMSCAKNIVAVGDLKQLPHIADDTIKKIEPPLDQEFNIQPGYSYQSESLLSSLETIFSDSAPITLLKEHYRCHPRIIDFCNQKFYDGKLVIMTENDNEPFKIFKTPPGNHNRRPKSGKSLLNQRELDVIAKEILDEEFIGESLDTVGITSPYRAQVDHAKKHIAHNGVQIDTVYKYQGREKDTIIFSTISSNINKFVNNPHLLNVAVSRAKNRFYMVTSQDVFKKQGSNIGDLIRHIEYQSLSKNIFESKTVSIFDCLYKEYADVLRSFRAKVKNKSKWLSENLMATLLDEILENDCFNSFGYHTSYALNLLINDDSQLSERELKFGYHPNAHVDFLLFNKLDKLPVLAIEVDGYRYHKLNDAQIERDKLKDSILKKMNLPLVRCGTESSGEKEKIEAALKDLLVEVGESKEELFMGP